MAALGSVQQRGRRAPQYAGTVAGLLVGLLLGALVLAPHSTRPVAAKLAQAGELRGLHRVVEAGSRCGAVRSY